MNSAENAPSPNRDNLLTVKEVFDEYGLDFWLMFGCFLGLYRDGDLISYDTDIDLALRSEDEGLYNKCEKALFKKGFKEICTHKHARAVKRHGVSMDFLFFKDKGRKKIYGYVDSIDSADFEKYNFVTWMGKEFRIFCNPERWLKYIYGADWKTPIKGRHAANQVYGGDFEK